MSKDNYADYAKVAPDAIRTVTEVRVTCPECCALIWARWELDEDNEGRRCLPRCGHCGHNKIEVRIMA